MAPPMTVSIPLPPAAKPAPAWREKISRWLLHDCQTVADVANRWQRPPNAKVLLGVKAAELANLFTTRVVGYTPS